MCAAPRLGEGPGKAGALGIVSGHGRSRTGCCPAPGSAGSPLCTGFPHQALANHSKESKWTLPGPAGSPEKERREGWGKNLVHLTGLALQGITHEARG